MKARTPNSKPSTAALAAKKRGKATSHRFCLCSISEIPEHLKEPFVFTGYRNNFSFAATVKSLFTIHNGKKKITKTIETNSDELSNFVGTTETWCIWTRM
jgi:hypothetical protein